MSETSQKVFRGWMLNRGGIHTLVRLQQMLNEGIQQKDVARSLKLDPTTLSKCTTKMFDIRYSLKPELAEELMFWLRHEQTGALLMTEEVKDPLSGLSAGIAPTQERRATVVIHEANGSSEELSDLAQPRRLNPVTLPPAELLKIPEGADREPRTLARRRVAKSMRPRLK